jgi:hypothetical protein
MNPIDNEQAGNGQSEPGSYPGRDFPPPPIDDPPADPGSDQPPVRDPPLRPEGDPPKIA